MLSSKCGSHRWKFSMNNVSKYSHSYLLLVLLLLVDATGLIEAADHHFLKRHLPEVKRSRGHREVSTRQGRSFKTQLSTKTLNKTEKEKAQINIPSVTVQTGTTATLNCNVTLRNVTVMWYKKNKNQEDDTLLVINRTTFTRDKRFIVSNLIDTDWSLRIRYTANSDKGIYECQVCTDKTSSSFVELILVEAHAEIFGTNPKVVKAGSPLRLSCVLKSSIDAPTYIFWYHWDRMINYDLGNGAAVRRGRQGSELIFPRAQPKHAGNYSCVPSNARQASVIVDVLYNEKQAVLQHDSKSNAIGSYRGDDHIVNMLLLILTFHIYR